MEILGLEISKYLVVIICCLLVAVFWAYLSLSKKGKELKRSFKFYFNIVIKKLFGSKNQNGYALKEFGQAYHDD